MTVDHRVAAGNHQVHRNTLFHRIPAHPPSNFGAVISPARYCTQNRRCGCFGLTPRKAVPRFLAAPFYLGRMCGEGDHELNVAAMTRGWKLNLLGRVQGQPKNRLAEAWQEARSEPSYGDLRSLNSSVWPKSRKPTGCSPSPCRVGVSYAMSCAVIFLRMCLFPPMTGLFSHPRNTELP